MWALTFELLYSPPIGVIRKEREAGEPKGGLLRQGGNSGSGGQAGMKEGSDRRTPQPTLARQAEEGRAQPATLSEASTVCGWARRLDAVRIRPARAAKCLLFP